MLEAPEADPLMLCDTDKSTSEAPLKSTDRSTILVELPLKSEAPERSRLRLEKLELARVALLAPLNPADRDVPVKLLIVDRDAPLNC